LKEQFLDKATNNRATNNKTANNKAANNVTKYGDRSILLQILSSLQRRSRSNEPLMILFKILTKVFSENKIDLWEA
jgi:hypothetical protein